MIDFRSEDDIRRAFKEVAAWAPPPQEGGAHGPKVISLAPRRAARPRSAAAVAGAAALLAVALAGLLLSRQTTEPFAAADGEWVPMAESPLAPRFDPVTMWTGTELLVWGGHDAAGDEYADGAAYDPSRDRWRGIADFPFDYEVREVVEFEDHRVSFNRLIPGVWLDGRAIFVAGDPAGPLAWNVVAYDPATDSWNLLDAARFDQRPGDELVLREGTTTVHAPVALAAVGDELVVFGRHYDHDEFGWARFDPATGEWGSFTGIPGSDALYGIARPRIEPVVIDGRHLVWLRSWMPDDGLPLGHAVDLRTSEVVPIDPPVDTRSLHLADVSDDGMVVGVGTDSSGRSRRVAARLDPATGRWTTVDPPAAGASTAEAHVRMGRLAGGHGSTFFIGGLGLDVVAGGLSTEPANLVWDPAGDRWHDLPPAPIDLGRVGHVSLWTGDELIVWGGATADTSNAATVPLADGARYRPG